MREEEKGEEKGWRGDGGGRGEDVKGRGNLLQLQLQLQAPQRRRAWKEGTEARSSRRSIRRGRMARFAGQHRASRWRARQ